MCIEREKDNFKSREVNCLKECALALNNPSLYIIHLPGCKLQTVLVLYAARRKKIYNLSGH